MTERKILVPIDLSDINRPMVRIADAWAKRTGAALVFLYVVPDLSDRVIGPAAIQNTLNVFHTHDKEVVRRVSDQVEKFLDEQAVTSRHETLIRQGKPYSQVLEVAREYAVDLIIMAAHDHTVAERALLGSNTDRVLHHAHCPVYVYRS